MSYGKVKDTFWTDKKVRAFSDDAKVLALYLMTGPHRNILGCMRVPDGYILADLGWSPARLRDAIAMLCERQFICRDDDGWTIILNQLRHDPLKVPNHALAAIALAEEVPTDSPVYQHLKPRLTSNLEAIGMASKWHPKEIAIPEPSPLPSPLPLPAPHPEEAAVAASVCEEAIQAFNEMAKACGLATVQRPTKKRLAALRGRLSDCGGIAGWRGAVAKVAESPFLRGEGPRGWKATFDFLMQPESFARVMEGVYAPTSAVAPPAEPPREIEPDKRLRDATPDERELARRVGKFCGSKTTNAEVAGWRQLDNERDAA